MPIGKDTIQPILKLILVTNEELHRIPSWTKFKLTIFPFVKQDLNKVTLDSPNSRKAFPKHVFEAILT